MKLPRRYIDENGFEREDWPPIFTEGEATFVIVMWVAALVCSWVAILT